MSFPRKADIVIGLGSNLENPPAQLTHAIRALSEHPEISDLEHSAFVRSRPLAGMEQPDYCNAVAMAKTALSPHAVLALLLSVEERCGRKRSGERWLPRTLDLDLLDYDSCELADEKLTLPHPEIRHRSFVVQPWLSLNPEASLPHGERLADLEVARSSDLVLWIENGRDSRIIEL